MWLKVVNLLVCMGSLMQYGTHAFWWGSTATTEPPTVLKHIPLTYYRTYTYQPLFSSLPYAFPYIAAHSPNTSPVQTPILTGARYDPHQPYASSYTGPLAALSAASLELLKGPVDLDDSSRTTKTTPKTTTSTTTTTTTTLAPSTASLPNANDGAQRIEPLINGGSIDYGMEYPTYNRRIYNSNQFQAQNYRRYYPHPDYYNYNSPPPPTAATTTGATPSSPSSGARAPSFSGGASSTSNAAANIQFVPCLCPINLPEQTQTRLGEQRSAIYYTQSRSAAETEVDDNDMQLSNDEMLSNSDIISKLEPVGPAQTQAEQATEKNQLKNKNDGELYGAGAAQPDDKDVKQPSTQI